jgi:hypothetical protein
VNCAVQEGGGGGGGWHSGVLYIMLSIQAKSIKSNLYRKGCPFQGGFEVISCNVGSPKS